MVRESVSGLYCSGIIFCTDPLEGSTTTIPPFNTRGDPGNELIFELCSVASHAASNVVRCVELFDGDADAIGLQLAKAAHPGGPVLARGAIIGDRPLELPRGHPNRTGECR